MPDTFDFIVLSFIFLLMILIWLLSRKVRAQEKIINENFSECKKDIWLLHSRTIGSVKNPREEKHYIRPLPITTTES